jgi:predicted NUDIX family NTP pyrophosphohydrolase
MAKRSAGILLYKRERGELLVLLVHPGGPYWRNKDKGAWSIPKGECGPREDPLAAAVREFAEETGLLLAGDFEPLGELVQSSRKTVSVWSSEGDFDPATLVSNVFEMEWPPRSGRLQSFPEADRAAWFRLPEAREKIHQGQREFLERLVAKVAERERR